MCSTKWEIPFCATVSSREPEFTQTPMETLRTCGMLSVSTSRPFVRTVRRMLRGVEAVEIGGARVADIF
jgi:D-serine deaminase-like pyridoxal phosphate-dependent protein